MATPPTLEDQCLLCLICRLEEYPPAALASLPLHLRLILLQNLPAADVCQLEHTAVTEGIDMDLTVWKELVRTRTEHTRATVPFGDLWNPRMAGHCCTFKQEYFADVYTLLFLGYFKLRDARSLLFSFCLKARTWMAFAHMFTDSCPIPSRHVSHNSAKGLLFFAVQNPDCRPVGIAINCTRFTRSTFWLDRDVVMSNMLSVIFSDTKSFKFKERALSVDDTDAFSVPEFFYQVIFNKPQLALTSLSLTGGADFLYRALEDTSIFFSTDSVEYLEWSQYAHQMLSGPVPYNGLTSISITLECEDEDRSSLYQDEGLLSNIHSVILHQSSLESLELSLDHPYFSSAPVVLTMCDALGKLFLQPQFKSLQLFSMELDWKCFSSLILPFFASSICNQTLHFEFLDLDLEGLNQQHGVLPDQSGFSPTRGHGKVLKLLWFAVGDLGHLAPFFHWLSQCQCSQVCSDFEFIYQEEHGAEVTAPFMDLVTQVPQFEVFTVYDVGLPLEPSPVVPFSNLFMGPHLRYVELRCCGIGKSGLLPCLTQGLLKQIPEGKLEELCLDQNQLDTVIDTDFQNFCEAVFSLPRVTELTLRLQLNQLEQHHFSFIHDAWKTKASRRKIKSFQAQDGNDCRDETSQLLFHDIALDIL